jgi:hypothetical protein
MRLLSPEKIDGIVRHIGRIAQHITVRLHRWYRGAPNYHLAYNVSHVNCPGDTSFDGIGKRLPGQLLGRCVAVQPEPLNPTLHGMQPAISMGKIPHVSPVPKLRT